MPGSYPILPFWNSSLSLTPYLTWRRDAVKCQHIVQRHYALQLAYVAAAYNGQNPKLGRAHPLQCHVQGMIRMHVNESVGGEQFRQGFGGAALPGLLSAASMASRTLISARKTSVAGRIA
jgi:hypothetical protein